MTPSALKWVDQAKYDLESARAMMSSGRWLYVLFCCQQAIEKALKSVIVSQTGEFPPRIHNLARLAELAELERDSKRDLFLSEISAYYIQCRYPEEIEDISNIASRELAAETLKQTEDVAQWLFSMTR